MKILITLLMAWSSFTWASTFVGNGGNVGDVELQVTLQQILTSFSRLKDNSAAYPSLCECLTEFRSRSICQPLENLKDKQLSYCKQTLKDHAGEVMALLDGSAKVKFSWSRESMTVSEKGGERDVDAASNTNTRTITIKQNRFLELSPQERVFLVTHELFHFIPLAGKLPLDTDPLGPFDEANGGRKVLNALGAGASMLAYQSGSFTQQQQAALDRSQSTKDIWLEGGWLNTQTGSEGRSSFNIKEWEGGEVSVRYQLSRFQLNSLGVVATFGMKDGKRDILTTIKATESLRYYGLGLAYRFFPWQNPMTFFGQSHFVVNAMFNYLVGKYSVHDISLEDNADTSSTGLTVGCKYFIPFHSNFWGFAGVTYSLIHHKYDLEQSQISVEYDKNTITPTLGVGYGF